MIFWITMPENLAVKFEKTKAGAKCLGFLFLAGDERIELPLRVLETPVMPFDQSPI